MDKKYKITNIILFVLNIAVQVFNAVMYAECMRLMNDGTTDALAIIALLPLFLIGVAVALVLSIVMSIICKRAKRQTAEAMPNSNKLIKVLTIIAWGLVIVDVILFALLYVL